MCISTPAPQHEVSDHSQIGQYRAHRASRYEVEPGSTGKVLNLARAHCLLLFEGVGDQLAVSRIQFTGTIDRHTVGQVLQM